MADVINEVVTNVVEETTTSLVENVAENAAPAIVEKACKVKVVAITVGAGLALTGLGIAAYKGVKKFINNRKAAKLAIDEKADEYDCDFDDEEFVENGEMPAEVENLKRIKNK